MDWSRSASLRTLAVVAAAALTPGCADSVPAPAPAPPNSRTTTIHLAPTVEQEVDILFVIGTPNCMWEEQELLGRHFLDLLSAIRSKHFAAGDLPNLHLGIISSDLGAGAIDYGSCKPGGDGGKLQSLPRMPEPCATPTQPYIAHAAGKTNIQGAAPDLDALGQILRAFQCTSQLGNGGCPFMHHLESARRALDPDLKVNPGFLRPDARLAVVFVTNMDDCSAQDPAFFASAAQPLGPLGVFRCYRHGLTCTCADGKPCPMTQVGPRKSCKPAGSWLRPVDAYVSFFKGLKPAGRVSLYALSGPPRVEVGHSQGRFFMQRACTGTSTGAADPPVRLRAAVEGMGPQGFFNVGLDHQGQRLETQICDGQTYRPALRFIGQSIRAALTARCIPAPLVIPGRAGEHDGGPGGCDACAACAGGERAGARGPTCTEGNLHRARCSVELIERSRLRAGTKNGEVDGGALAGRPVERCPRALFDDPSARQCAGTCPCWRLVRSAACNPDVAGSPHAIELVGGESLGEEMMVRVSCLTSSFAWDSEDYGRLGQPSGQR